MYHVWKLDGNWKVCSGVLCDKKMPVKPKGKLIYRIVLGKASIGVWCRYMGRK